MTDHEMLLTALLSEPGAHSGATAHDGGARTPLGLMTMLTALQNDGHDGQGAS